MALEIWMQSRSTKVCLLDSSLRCPAAPGPQGSRIHRKIYSLQLTSTAYDNTGYAPAHFLSGLTVI